MKTQGMNFGILAVTLVAGALVCAGTAYAQTEKQPPTEKQIINKPGEPPIALHRVTGTSPTVDLAAVSKEVSPGVLEVDPNVIAGKRLVVPGSGKGKNICLGKWITLRSGPTCEGSWVQM
ncbi:MAG TPA: hypothetical protein VMN79_04595 [Casimicrobiaceae bacterium]|nr:hypothetical protein [Casimicrobiaceae bacterium]